MKQLPVIAQTSPEFEERILSEGMLIQNTSNTFPSGYVFDGVSTPTMNGGVIDTNSYFFSLRAALANCLYIKSAQGWISSRCLTNVTVGANVEKICVGPNGWAKSYNLFIGPKETFSSAVVGLTEPTGTVGNKIMGFGSALVYQLSADQDRSKPYRMLILGDSNSQGTAILSGGTSAIIASSLTYKDLWQHKWADWYTGRGYLTRVIDKSIATLGSTNYETYRQQGKFNLPDPPHLIGYDLGTNDPNATTLANNVTAFCKWARTKWPANPLTGYPGVKIVVSGQIPMQAASAESQAASNRSAVQTAVSNLSDPFVIYVNLGLAFSASDNTQYSGTEATGSGIHMSATGQTSKANYLISVLNNNPTFKTL